MKLGGKPKCFCTKSFIQITLKKNYYKVDLRKERENSIILITPKKSFDVIYLVGLYIS